MADLMTVAWKVYGISEMTRSLLPTSLSRADSSVTSREMGLVFLRPSESFWADLRVLQAVFYQQAAFVRKDERSGKLGEVCWREPGSTVVKAKNRSGKEEQAL